MNIFDEMGHFDGDVSDENELSNLVRLLPESFGSFAMVSIVTENRFQYMIEAIQAEIERSKKEFSPARIHDDTLLCVHFISYHQQHPGGSEDRTSFGPSFSISNC